MRKRSGAFHSQTEQEFLLLAQLSHQKTGYFYDESVHSQLSQQIKKQKGQSSPKPQKDTLFEGFEYSSQDIQKQEEQKALSRQSKRVLINIVLLCNHQANIKLILSEIWPSAAQNQVQSPESRKMDLFIAKTTKNHQEYCIKFWIIDPKQAQNPIYHSYLTRSSRILNFSTENSIGEQYPFSQVREVLSSQFV